jgi:caffeoyl-CoA O-methyltransferase
VIITNPRIEKYIMKRLPERDEVLREMEKYAERKGFPIIGPMNGRFLRQLAMITKAKRILELGSGYGYSAYWFAGGMRPGGKIICTDLSEENRKRARGFLKRGGFGSRVDFRVGDALEVMRKTKGLFDIILNDIDKERYPEALEAALPRLRPGGIFITDNVLWSGKILSRRPTVASRAILEFNRRLFVSKEAFSSIIPIRDGLALAVKKG